jgi:hypothetical protein
MKINRMVSTLPDKLKAAIERVETDTEFIIHSFQYMETQFLRLLKLSQILLSWENVFVGNIWEFCRMGKDVISYSTNSI